MAQKSEIIILSADISPVKGWQVFWAFSKKQLDMILHDVETVQEPSQEEYVVSAAVWQNETLPVISLEKYFGLAESNSTLLDKYAVVKDVVDDSSQQRLGRLMIRTSGNIRVREVDFAGFPASAEMLPARQGDVLGVYSLSGRQLLILPDIKKIHGRAAR